MGGYALGLTIICFINVVTLLSVLFKNKGYYVLEGNVNMEPMVNGKTVFEWYTVAKDMGHKEDWERE